jgi:hypothetical protein
MSATTQSVTIRFARSFATFIADCAVEERHDDSWVITEHPVEVGSTTADHVYKLPATVVLTYLYNPYAPNTNTPAGSAPGSFGFMRDLYAKMLAVQNPVGGVVTPFSVSTGKRNYDKMLLQNLAVTTDSKTENILSIRATCREIIMATTILASTGLSTSSVANPVSHGPVLSYGARQAVLGGSPVLSSAAQQRAAQAGGGA